MFQMIKINVQTIFKPYCYCIFTNTDLFTGVYFKRLRARNSDDPQLQWSCLDRTEVAIRKCIVDVAILSKLDLGLYNFLLKFLLVAAIKTDYFHLILHRRPHGARTCLLLCHYFTRKFYMICNYFAIYKHITV